MNSFLFRTLANRHQKQVYALAYRMSGNQSDAEDATQEAYERLWKHIDRIQEDDARAWLMHVTRNLCIDKIRAKRATEELETDGHYADNKTQPGKALAVSQLSDWLKKAITIRSF